LEKYSHAVEYYEAIEAILGDQTLKSLRVAVMGVGQGVQAYLLSKQLQQMGIDHAIDIYGPYTPIPPAVGEDLNPQSPQVAHLKSEMKRHSEVMPLSLAQSIFADIEAVEVKEKTIPETPHEWVVLGHGRYSMVLESMERLVAQGGLKRAIILHAHWPGVARALEESGYERQGFLLDAKADGRIAVLSRN